MEVALAAGFEEVVNDPMLWRHGARVGVAMSPAPYLEIAVAAAYYPVFDYSSTDPDIRDPEQWDVLSWNDGMLGGYPKLRSQVQAVARVLPIYGSVGHWTIWAGGHAGFAATETVMIPEDPAPAWRASPVFGGTAEIQRGPWGFRLRVEELRYVEPLWSDVKTQLTVGTEVMLWLL